MIVQVARSGHEAHPFFRPEDPEAMASRLCGAARRLDFSEKKTGGFLRLGMVIIITHVLLVWKVLPHIYHRFQSKSSNM